MCKNAKTLYLYRVPQLLSGVILTFIAIPHAHAQAPLDSIIDVEPAVNEAPAADDIVVTGSRIKRTDLTSPSPVNLLSEDEIRASGETNIADILSDQPQFGASFGATNQNYSSLAAGFGGGTELVNLRNLGTQRTLVLVNGRRHIGGDPGTSSVDLNSIPFSMVERVDIVSGAASAVYGADAISGVVNIVFKKKFEGFEVRGDAGVTSEGGGENVQLSAILGDSFASSRGSVLFGIEYDKSWGLVGSERAHSAIEGQNFVIGGTAGSTAIPGGRIMVPRGSFTFAPSGALVPWNGERYQRIGFRGLDNPTKRLAASAALDYSFIENDDGFSLSGYAEASYSRVNSTIKYEPLPILFDGSAGTAAETPFSGPLVPITNPFLQPFLSTLGPIPAGGVTILRRLVEYGPRTTVIDRDMFRIATGVRGNIGGKWTYDAYYQHGRIDSVQRDTGALDRYRFFAGLNVEPNGAGGFQCADARYRQLGCTPVNLFAFQGITQQFIDYTTIQSLAVTESSQDVVSGYATGPILNLPAGTMTAVLGAEYRREKTAIRPDDSYTSRANSNRFLNGVVGGYDVSEIFGELRIPLLDQPGFRDLTLGLAARYSDYSTINGQLSYSASLEWRPIQDLLLRGVYATAVRAPNVRELFAPAERVVVSITDPCDTRDDLSRPIAISGPRLAACSQDLGSLAATFDQTQTQRQSIGAISGGNADLKGEEGRTFTLGAVYTPAAFLPGATFSIDYIDIDIKDVVTALAGQTILNSCYDDPSRPAALCSAFTRDAASGRLLSVNSFLFNAAAERLKALDVQFGYATEFGPGRVSVNASWSHLFKHTLLTEATAALDDKTGQIGDFRNRYNFSLTYDIDGFGVQWNTRILGAAVADTTIKRNSALFELNRISSVDYHDVRLSYDFSNDRFQLSAGVENLFDRQPPVITAPARTLNSSGMNTATDLYDVRGRYFYAGFVARF